MKTLKELATTLQDITDDTGQFTVKNIDTASFTLARSTTAEAVAIKTLLLAAGYDVQLVLIGSLVQSGVNVMGVSIGINLDYLLSAEDQDSNRAGETLGFTDVYDLNLTVEFTYRSGEPQTLYSPEFPEEYDIDTYYIAGVYESGAYIPISQEQSDLLLSLKPAIIDDLKLRQCVIDAHTDSLDRDPF